MKRSLAVLVGVGVVATLGVGMTATDDTDAAAGTTLVAFMTDASPLETGSVVRAAGVKVGSVSDIRLENEVARVELDLHEGVLPLHEDSSLQIDPVNLLGEHYVKLDPGSPDAPFMNSNVIPKERTDSTVTLQDVINTFDDPTSTATAALLTTLGEGLAGRGKDAASAIKALAPSMKRTEEMGRLLSSQNAVLGKLVEQAEPVAAALADDKGTTLDLLVGSSEKTLSTLAANRRALDATLAELPETLTTARKTLRELAGVADATTPTLQSVRPAIGDLDEITNELQRFADAADPALASLLPVLKRADKLLDQAAPVVDRLRTAGPDLRGTAASARPLGEELLHAHLGDLMDFVRKWSLSTNGRDALSHYFRGVVHVTPKTLQDLAESLVPSAGRPSEQGTATDAKQPTPGDKAPSLDKVAPSLPLIGGGQKSDSNSATGMTPEQERSMLGQLLGVN
ncbi:hypothetical protein GCM10025762_14030 [Haloechinothrix salitolerans]